MTEANHRPSYETRRLLARAWTQARHARDGVNRFAIVTRQAMLAFDVDVKAWGLADEDYRVFEEASGMRRVLDAAERMSVTLTTLFEDRAA